MSSDIDNSLDKIKAIIEETENVLSKHDYKTSLQVPTLLDAVASKLNCSSKDIDTVVRWHLHNSTTWEIKRGIKGGVRPKEAANSSSLSDDEKKAIKDEINAKLAEKLAI